jgi:hypothetical protein
MPSPHQVMRVGIYHFDGLKQTIAKPQSSVAGRNNGSVSRYYLFIVKQPVHGVKFRKEWKKTKSHC